MSFPLIRRFTIGSGVGCDYTNLQSWWGDWGGRNLINNNEIIIADMAPQLFVASGHLDMNDGYFSTNSVTDAGHYYMVRGQYGNCFDGNFNGLPNTPNNSTFPYSGASGTILRFDTGIAGIPVYGLSNGQYAWGENAYLNDLDFFGVRCKIPYTRFENFTICNANFNYWAYPTLGASGTSQSFLNLPNIKLHGIDCINTSGVIIDSVAVGDLSIFAYCPNFNYNGASPPTGYVSLPLYTNPTTISAIGIQTNNSVVRNCMVYDIYAAASGFISGSGSLNIQSCGILSSGFFGSVLNNTVGRCQLDNFALTPTSGTFTNSNPYPAAAIGMMNPTYNDVNFNDSILGTPFGFCLNNYAFQSPSGYLFLSSSFHPTLIANASDQFTPGGPVFTPTFIPQQPISNLSSSIALLASGNLRANPSGKLVGSGVTVDTFNWNYTLSDYNPFSWLFRFSWDFEGQPRLSSWTIGADQSYLQSSKTVYGKNTFTPDGLPLYVGPPANTETAFLPLYLHENVSSGYIPLYISTFDNLPHISGFMPLVIPGLNPAPPSPPGPQPINNDIPLYLFNVQTGEYGEYGTGDPQYYSLGLNLTLLASKQSLSNLMSLYIGAATPSEVGDISLFLENAYSDINGNITLFIEGLSLSGAEDSSGIPSLSTMPLFMERIPGDGIPLYISGKDVEDSNGQITLFMDALYETISNLDNGDIFTLLLTSFDYSNANAKLYIRGF